VKTLVFGGCYVDTEHKREVVTLWARLARNRAPNMSIALFDSASPFDPLQFIPRSLDIDIYSFPENAGHLSHGGGDGAGRALCAGLEHAIEWEFDYAVHWGTDLVFAKPIDEVIGRVSKAEVEVACLGLSQYQFYVWEFAVFAVPWLKRTNFIQKYDWRSVRGPYPHFPRPSLYKKMIPEWRLQEIAGDDLWMLPYSGHRNIGDTVTFANMEEAFPYYPPVWLHMANDMRTYRRFLELNGVAL